MKKCKPVHVPIDGTLDLHTFQPKEVKQLVPDYIDECRKRGILDVRIIHGKGMGIQRQIVHSLLEKNPYVEWFGLAGESAGGWGATLVRLKRDHVGGDSPA